MKYLNNLVLVIFLMTLVSCQNEPWDFPDYKFSSTYFPYQYPFRTLELGDDYVVDNSKDNLLQFSIGINIAGMYSNNNNRKVDIVVDNSLANNLYTDKGDTLVVLPTNYYSLSSNSVTIPIGKMYGFVDVQLTDAFLDDPRAFSNRYVIPLRIISAETDSILTGLAAKLNPDLRVASDWTVKPKNFTLFGIKFINPYHGNYLLRGKDVYKSLVTNLKDSVIYHKKFIEDNEVQFLKTTARNQVIVIGKLRRVGGNGSFPTTYKMLLTCDTNGNIVISSDVSSAYSVAGSGKFIRNGDVWGGKNRNQIILNYQVADPNYSETHTINDTLVLRDRAITLETYNPVIK